MDHVATGFSRDGPRYLRPAANRLALSRNFDLEGYAAAFGSEAEGLRRVRREVSPDWVLMDGGDLVIHLFKPEARETYAIERMWGPHSPGEEEASPVGEEG